MSVKCLVYSRFSTSVTINTVIKDTGNAAMIADAEKIASKIKLLKLKEGEREKLQTDYGVWFVTRDRSDFSYALCTAASYPQRHAFGLFGKLQDKIGEMQDSQYETEEVIKSYTKKTAQQLVNTYSDLSKIDKVLKVRSQVQELQLQLGTGIKKLIGNQETLNSMSEKAEKMKGHAEQFSVNSEKLERMMYWRNCKIKIIIGLCVVGLVGFVILVIVQKTQGT